LDSWRNLVGCGGGGRALAGRAIARIPRQYSGLTGRIVTV